MSEYPPEGPPNGRTNGWHPVPPTPPVNILIEPAWQKQPGESRQAYAAFCIFRDMPAPRSMDGAYRTHRGLPMRGNRVAGSPRHGADGRWQTWARAWRWSDRVDAFDASLEREARSAAEARARADGERLAIARSAQREKELELGDLLIRRASEMLLLPPVERTVERMDETGRPVEITFKPAPRWNFRDAAKFIEVATQMRRLALDMETSRSTINVDMEDEVRQLAKQFGFDEEVAVEMVREFQQAG
jgi:hypothetical protein